MQTTINVVLLARVSRWIGRCVALLLCLFWGMFFVEHLWEWFLKPGGGFPPARIWVAQGFHGLMLVGLLLTWKWEGLGTALLVLATIAFFGIVGFHRFPFIALINAAPVVCFALAWTLKRTGPSAAVAR